MKRDGSRSNTIARRQGLGALLLIGLRSAVSRRVPAALALVILLTGLLASAVATAAGGAAGNDPRATTVELARRGEELNTRVRALEDKDAIATLLSRYSLNVDLNRAADLLQLFTDDCVFASDLGGELRYRRGKAELAEMLAQPPPKGQHLQLDYQVDVSGDSATAIGYQLLSQLKDGAVGVGRPAFRLLRFRRSSGRWLIAEIYTVGIGNEPEYRKLLPDHL